MRCDGTGQVGKASLVRWVQVAETQIWGSLANWLHHTAANPPRQVIQVLTMVETTTECLEMNPVPHTKAQNTILGLEMQLLQQHGTLERAELD